MTHCKDVLKRIVTSVFSEDKYHLLVSANILCDIKQSSSAKQEQGTAQTVFVTDCDMLSHMKTGLTSCSQLDSDML